MRSSLEMPDRVRDRPEGEPPPDSAPPHPAWWSEIEDRVRGYLEGGSTARHGEWLNRATYASVRRVFSSGLLSSEERIHLTQETVVRVFQKLETYRFQAPFRAWVRMIAVNALGNHLRNRRSGSVEGRSEPLEPLRWDSTGQTDGEVREELWVEPDAEANAEAAETRRLLSAALHELPPGMRRCLLLSGEGFTSKEIGEILGISDNTVRWQISKGYKRLRPLLAPDFPEYARGED